MTGAVRSFAGRVLRRSAEDPPRDARPQVPMTRWDNVGISVERSVQTFVPAASAVHGVLRIDAKSSGPSVHFLVTTDVSWDRVIEGIEERLFELGHRGELPPFDYDVRQVAGKTDLASEPGYLQVFPS